MPPKATQSTATNAVETLWKAYNENTPDRLKFIDSFLLFLMLSGVVQFAYCVLVSSFPYNAFLSGYVVSGLFVSSSQADSLQVSAARLDSLC
jgi:oligosaccharyltransferase complex subunit epsilon